MGSQFIIIHLFRSIQIYDLFSDVQVTDRLQTGYRQVTDRLHYGYVFVSPLFPVCSCQAMWFFEHFPLSAGVSVGLSGAVFRLGLREGYPHDRFVYNFAKSWQIMRETMQHHAETGEFCIFFPGSR